MTLVSLPDPNESRDAAIFHLPRKHLFFVAAALLTLCLTIGYSFFLVSHLGRISSTIVRPVRELATETALAHLWTEETITGDPAFTPTAIDRNYAKLVSQVDTLHEVLLDAEWMHSPFQEESDLPVLLAEVRSQIASAREIAIHRLAAPAESQPGSPADLEQDAAFLALFETIGVFTAAADETVESHYRVMKGIQAAMTVCTVVLGIWVAILLWRYERRRLRDLATIVGHNTELQATNQQLMATEQQLRASNQQLMATEQQLRAANQQLTATEQELRHSNEQLAARGKELLAKNSELLASQSIIEASERRYRTLIGNMAEGVAIHRLEPGIDGRPRDYRIIEVNNQFEAILGLRREQVEGRLATEVYGTEEAPYLAEYAAVAMGGPAVRFETHFPALDRFFSISVSSFERGMFVTVFSDVTDRKKVEEAIRLNEARLAGLLEITQHPVASPEQLFEYALDKALHLTRSRHGGIFFPDSTSGRLLRSAAVCRDEGRCDAAGCAIEQSELAGRVLREKAPVLHEMPDQTLATAESRHACLRILGVPLLSGGAVAAVVLLADKDTPYDSADIRQTTLLMDAVLRMVELRRAEDERHRLEVRMQKLESLGVLAGGIAHDFNNLLAGILANVNLAAMAGDNGAEAAARLAEAERATLRAKGLTQQLLTFSRGGTPIRRVTALPELVIESATFAVRGSSARCVFSFAPNLWSVEIDGGQISQVVNNLALNAAQAMPEGGIIEVGAENVRFEPGSKAPLTPGDYVRLTVADRGVGIAPELLEKIFDPWFTTKQQGSGLGLAASHAIVNKHHGAILVNSRPEEGTTFTVYLPASRLPPQEEADDPPLPAKGSGRILVMDDDPALRKLLAQILLMTGYDPVLTEEGMQAVETYRQAMAENRGFEAVILDLTVAGGMGGREALARIREIDPEVKAIVSSGYSNDPVMANYRSHGFLGVISKPYTVREMQAELRRVRGA